MAQVIWTEPALIDLEQIADYIAIDKPTVAEKLVKDAFDKVERLIEFPNSGKKPSELPKKTPYREIIVGPLRVFYRYDGKLVTILYVMRSERILRQFLLSDRSKNES